MNIRKPFNGIFELEDKSLEKELNEANNDIILRVKNQDGYLLPEQGSYDPTIESVLLKDSKRSDSLMIGTETFSQSAEYSACGPDVDHVTHEKYHQALEQFFMRTLLSKCSPSIDQQSLYLKLITLWVQGAGAGRFKGAMQTSANASLAMYNMSGSIECKDKVQLFYADEKIYADISLYDIKIKYTYFTQNGEKIDTPIPLSGAVAIRAVFTDNGWQLLDIKINNPFVKKLLLNNHVDIEQIIVGEAVIDQSQDPNLSSVKELQKVIADAKQIKQQTAKHYETLESEFNALDISSAALKQLLAEIYHGQVVEVCTKQFNGIEDLLLNKEKELNQAEIKTALARLKTIKEAKEKAEELILQEKNYIEAVKEEAGWFKNYYKQQILQELAECQQFHEIAVTEIIYALEENGGDKVVDFDTKLANLAEEVSKNNTYAPHLSEKCRDALKKYHIVNKTEKIIKDNESNSTPKSIVEIAKIIKNQVTKQDIAMLSKNRDTIGEKFAKYLIAIITFGLLARTVFKTRGAEFANIMLFGRRQLSAKTTSGCTADRQQHQRFLTP